MSHSIILRGGDYGAEPTEGTVQVEVRYYPRHDCPLEMEARHVKKLMKLRDEMYDVPNEPDE